MGWMNRLFNNEEEVGPEAAHRAVVEHEKAAAPTHVPAQKKAGAAVTEHKTTEHAVHTTTEHAHAAAPAAAAKTAVAVPHQAAAPAHTHAPEQTGTPSHPTKSKLTGDTLEHDQMMTVHILTHVPEHAPREDDPHYHLFEQAKARLKKQGMWKCIIGDDLCDGEPELHHTHVEFSQINQVDESKIQQALGLHFTSDEEFQKWAESPGNLEVLCANHHRTHYGIHVLPGPLWEALRFHKTGTGPAAEFVTAKDAKDDGVPAAD
jgi:hypothetical protein